MATNLRVGGTYGYQPHREVEPVPAYPRVDQQQPRDQYPRQQASARDDRDETARRKFNAMRRLIDILKDSQRIVRVDYSRAEKDLREQALRVIEQHLTKMLQEQDFSPSEISDLTDQLRETGVFAAVQPGPKLKQEDNFLPEFIPGLREYRVNFRSINLLPAECPDAVHSVIDRAGYFVFEQDRIRFDIRPSLPTNSLAVNLSVLVAVGEADEEGRKVLLYELSRQNYALYADKQINLSI